MQTIIIVAMNQDRLIGRGGALPWHEPEDLKHFKQATAGHAVIMGRKTYDSIKRPLPGRRNIVVTRSAEALNSQEVKTSETAGAAQFTTLDYVHSIDEALALCRSRGEATAFIVGGAQIYEEALPVTDEMIVTYVDRPGLTGDTYFPQWREADWETVSETPLGAMKVVRYRRRDR